MTSREIARLIVADTGDRKAFSEAVKRVSKALRVLHQDGAVKREKARTGVRLKKARGNAPSSGER